MQAAIMIRVKPENYEVWYQEHSSQEEARREYGITDGPLYRDAGNPDVALVHLNVEDLNKAMEWFGSAAFRAAAQRAGSVERELWVAERRNPAQA